MGVYEIETDGGVYQVETEDAAPSPALLGTDNPSPLLSAGRAATGALTRFLPFGDEISAAGSAAISSLFGNENFSSAYDRKVEEVRGWQDAAKEASPVASGAIDVSGALALPNIGLVSKAKGFGQTAKALATEGSIIGALFGIDAGEGGIENRVTSGAQGALTGAAAGTVLGGGLVAAGKGVAGLAGLFEKYLPSSAGRSALQDPQIQRALQFAEREGYLNKPASEVTSIGKGTSQALDLVQKKAKNLGENIAAQLGANAGKSNYEKAMAEQFSEAVPELVKSGIFQKAGNVEELMGLAGARLDEINNLRTKAAQALDTQVLALNKADTPIKDMIGVVSTKSPEVQDALKELNLRMTKLNFNELSAPIANGIKSTTESIVRDITPVLKDGVKEVPLLGPGRVVTMLQNLNEVRRNLLKEFDTATIAAQITGNTPQNLGAMKASIEAVSKMQNALSNSLEGAVADLLRVSDSSVSPGLFSKLNKEYGALKALQDMGDKFTRATAEGRAVRDPTSIVQNTGADQVISSVFSPKKAAEGAAANILRSFKDDPTDILMRATSVENRSSNALKNIRDLISLSDRPAPLYRVPQKDLSPAIQRLFGAAGQGGSRASTKAVVDSLFGDSIRQEQRKQSQAPGPQGSIQQLFGVSASDKGTPNSMVFQDKLEPLVKAVIAQESAGNPKAVSDKGAEGLMQVMPATAKGIAKELGVKEYDLKDPETNKLFGTYYLSKLLDQFNGDYELALTAYHSGPARVESLLEKTGGSTLADILPYLGPVGKKYAKQVLARV